MTWWHWWRKRKDRPTLRRVEVYDTLKEAGEASVRMADELGWQPGEFHIIHAVQRHDGKWELCPEETSPRR